MSNVEQLTFPGIALGGLGVITFCAGAIRLYIEIRSRFWHKTKGVIISSEEKIETFPGPTGGTLSRIIPKIVFQYKFDGKNYIKTADIFSTGYRPSTEKILSQFSSGKSVVVMVNPHKPYLAKLECKLTPVSCSLILIGIVLIWTAYFLG